MLVTRHEFHEIYTNEEVMSDALPEVPSLMRESCHGAGREGKGTLGTLSTDTAFRTAMAMAC